MDNRLELPDDLQKLMEKREKQDRRGRDATQASGETASEPPSPEQERRSGADRRGEE